MDGYDIPNAVKPILPFIDDASNWYVRRSRRRFWKSDDDADKQNAYRTLHYVLVQLSMVLAPFTPFLAEELYQKLTGGESVHLLDWPKVGHVNELLVDQMSALRQLITDGLSQRAAAGIKVRQPLRMAEVRGKSADELAEFEEVLNEELNVKFTLFNSKTSVEGDNPSELVIELNLELDDELRSEGLMREVVRQVQNARKQAGLEVDDRIKLDLHAADNALSEAVKTHAATIKQETLATHLTTTEEKHIFHEVVRVEGQELTVSLEKSA
jgi:isoleucyl-tRNA synthetase